MAAEQLDTVPPADEVVPRIVIASSNLSVPRSVALMRSHDIYIDFLHIGNFDEEAGFEWTPLRFPHAIVAGILLAKQGLVSGVHESWRQGRWYDLPREARSDMLGEAAINVAFPLLDRSYGWLSLLQRSSPEDKLPIVIHPEGQVLGDKPERTGRPRQNFAQDTFGAVLVQPTAEWAWSQGINAYSTNTDSVASQIDELLQERGYGMALDLHHLRTERNGARFYDALALTGALAARMVIGRDEVQVSIRPEFGGSYDEATRIFNEGVDGTELGRMLEAVRDQAPEGTVRLVSEIQADVIKSIVGRSLRIGQVHAIINNSVRTLMAA